MHVTEADVVRAITRNQIIPSFQPLIELGTGRLSGFEVLARWDSPQHGPILPLNFIELTESTGLIGALTAQVLTKAFRQAPKLPTPLSLAVNISPAQMHFLTLPGEIRAAAEGSSFPLDRLTIEITESSLLLDLPRVQQVARALKDMGCRLALDDFGTGFSSLGHFQALPFDDVKIDRSFVCNMSTNREDRKIVTAIIGLGHSLGLTTVAEGVETEEQARILQWLGCEIGQGWLYGRPTLAATLDSIIAQPTRTVCTDSSRQGDGRAVHSFETLGQLQAIYDSAPVGLSYLDRDLRHVTMNRQLAEMTGISVGAYRGKTSAEVLSPLGYSNVEPFLKRALLGETIKNIESVRPAVFPGDHPRTILSSYIPAFDEGNEVIGLSVAVVDISERKRNEETIRANDEQHLHMLERHPQAAWTLDAHGDHLNVTQPWAQMTGFSEAWTRNLGWIECVHPDDGPRIRRAVKRSIKAGTPIDVEYRVRCIEGDWRWMRARGTTCIAATGEVLSWYGCIEDIQQIRQLKADLLECQTQIRSLYKTVRTRLRDASVPSRKLVSAQSTPRQRKPFLKAGVASTQTQGPVLYQPTAKPWIQADDARLSIESAA